MVYIEKSNWFTITDEEDGVQYYEFDKDTHLPVLKNIVGNIYKCTHAIYQENL